MYCNAQLMVLMPLPLLLLATATATAHASASATEATAHASALLVRVLSVTFILWLSTWAFCLQIYTQQKASGSPMGPLYKLVSCQRETSIDTILNAAWTYRVLGGRAGTSHWPPSLSPKATASPLLRISTMLVTQHLT